MKDKNVVFNSLIEFNSKTQNKGFKYLESAISMILNNPNDYKDGIFVTKLIYPSVARKHNTTSKRVERCMRSFIIDGYDSNPEKFHINGFNERPTNSNFISNLVMIIEHDKEII